MCYTRRQSFHLERSDKPYIKVNLTLDGEEENGYIPHKALVDIIMDGAHHQLSLKGNLFKDITSDGKIVLIGGLDGYFGVPTNEKTANENTVTLSVHYSPTSNSSFFALTVGSAGNGTNPSYFFFGDSDDKVLKAAVTDKQKFDSKNRDNESDRLSDNNEPIVTPFVDGTLRFKNTAYTNTSSGNVASVSVYYPNELGNQRLMTVFAKANSKTTVMKSYLQSSAGGGFGSMSIWPDTFEVEIIGADDKLHSTRSVAPTSGSTKIEFPLAFYLPVIGLQTIDIPITMSSTSVSFRQMVGGTSYYDNIVSWSIYKRYGWNLSDVDFSTSTPEKENNGIRVQSGYTYEGNVTSNISATLGANARVRYEFITGGLTLHSWTAKCTAASSVTIVP